jgi:hypothetical protein
MSKYQDLKIFIPLSSRNNVASLRDTFASDTSIPIRVSYNVHMQCVSLFVRHQFHPCSSRILLLLLAENSRHLWDVDDRDRLAEIIENVNSSN